MIITVYKNINNVKDRKRKHKTTNITKSKASSACHHKRKQGKKKERRVFCSFLGAGHQASDFVWPGNPSRSQAPSDLLKATVLLFPSSVPEPESPAVGPEAPLGPVHPFC